MAAKRPPLPRLVRELPVPLAELVRLVVQLSNDVRRFLAGFVSEYDAFVLSIGGSSGGSGGSGVSGTARLTTVGTTTIDFGAFPGAEEASVAIAAPSVLATSSVSARITPVATVDHSDDEHRLEPISVTAGAIIAGTGFTVYGLNANPTTAGEHSRIYGKWSLAWELV